MYSKRLLALTALIGFGSSTAMAEGTIELDMANVFFWGNSINVFETDGAGAQYGNAKIISIEWTGLSLETHNNVGVPYYGSEAMLGLEATNADGESEDIWFFPFPNANYQGTEENPIEQPDGETVLVNLEGYNIHLDPLGEIRGLVTAAWDDTSGETAGEWLGGTITINFEKIPAPGALALLGLAGLAGARRRRRR